MFDFPAIHFGVYKIPREETARAVEYALEVGYRGIDTARAYGNEKEAVEGIVSFMKKHPEVKREEIWYTTKVAQGEFGYNAAKAAIKDSAEIASPLGYLDLVLMHSSHGGPERRADTWRAFEEIKFETKLVREIGVSNWGVAHLEGLRSAEKTQPYINQIELNPWLQHRDIVEYCKRVGIIVEAWSPLTRGLRLEDPELKALSKKYSKSPAQILIKWALQSGFTPVPKSVTPERIKENFDVFNWELSKDDLKQLGDPNEYYVTSPAWDPTTLP